MKSTFTKDVIGIIILLVLFVAAGLFLAGDEGGGDRLVGFEEQPDPSVFNDRASGTRALYELASRLGYVVDVSRTDWRSLPHDASMLIAAEPNTRMSSEMTANGSNEASGAGILNGQEAAGITSWLKQGRTLLLMTDYLPASKASGRPSSLPGGDFGDAFGVSVGSALRMGNRKYFGPLQPIGIVRGVSCIRVHGQNRVLRDAGDGLVLFGSEPAFRHKGPVGGEAVVITYPVGKGRVIVIGDGYFACNGNLAREDNATFITNILSEALRPGQKVLFDEYHHGDISDSRNIWTALGSPAQRGIVQLICAALAMLFVLAPRFGTPRPMGDRTRRNTGEYVASLASLYRSAHATVPSLEFLYRQFLRDICSRLSLPPDISLANLAESAARRGQIDSIELKKLLGRCEHCLSTQSVSEYELLDLVRRMEQFRKELGID